MQSHSFEYSNHKLLLTMMLICFLVLFVPQIYLLVLLGPTEPGISATIPFWSFFVISVGLFFIPYKKYRKKGTAILSNSSISFELHNRKFKANLIDIEQFRTSSYGGHKIWIKTRTGHKFFVTASYFSKGDGLLDVIENTVKLIEEFNQSKETQKIKLKFR